MNRVRFFWAWEACCWGIISNPDLIAVCLLQCTVGSITTIGLSITINPPLSPPLSNIYPPPLFRGGKLISPPSLLSPPPPLHTYFSQTINVEWSVVVYSGWKFPLFSVFSPMTFNFMCWIFSTFCSTVSVKIVGTLVCLLFPSLLVYKVWWLNHDKQLWEGQGEHRRKKTGFGPSVSTIFVWDCSFLWRIVTIFLLLEIAV